MAYTVDPPGINELTGEREGDFTITNRDASRYELTVSDPTEIDPNEFNDALDPHYARQAIQANLPIFDENASDESVIAFWKSNQPLTDAEVSAIQAAYVATNNADIANLLMFRLTGDTSHLSEQQLDELGLTDYPADDETDSEGTEDESFDDTEVADFIINEATEPDEAIADEILSVDLGDSPEETAVQYLAYAYYNGQMTAEEAYSEAASSGLDPNKLYQAFTRLYNHFNN
jgi:hypothetical protein